MFYSLRLREDIYYPTAVMFHTRGEENNEFDDGIQLASGLPGNVRRQRGGSTDQPLIM